ncbi:ABC transporter permease [Ruminococcus sp. AM36-18]|jgi:putative ABC transport system permease protein|nr:FtsX-like permease family protein [Ruminococcus sp. AM36-18]RGH57728.1 ABC transporter permease [Ruminococcus sp. AM36-18]
MKLLNKLTLKNLRLNKVRTIVTIVGIMLSAALITVVSGMALSGRQTMIDAQKTWSGDYDVSLDIIDTAKIDEIRQNRNVENAYYKERLGFSKATVADNAEYGYAVTAISENAFDGCFKLKLEKGSFPTNSNEAVVTGAFKNTDGKDVKVGDKITLELGVLKGTDGKVLGESELLDLSPKRFKESKITDKKQKTYTITGIIENPNTRELNPSSCFEIYTVSDEESPVEAIRTKHMNKLYIAYTPQSEGNYLQNTADILGFKADDMSNVISDEISPEDQQTSGINGYSFNTTLLAMKGYGGSDGTNVMIFSLAVIIIIIVMLASVFVIRNSFAISITEKTSMYGMLASVGATKRQIRRNVLFEGFILGLIGIPLGILLGLGVNAILIAILNSVLGDMLSGATFVFVTPTIPIICAIVLSAVTIFLSSFFIALRASRIPPLVAIRGNKDIKVKNNKPYRTSKLTKKLFGVGGEIASKSLKRSRKKYRTTVISIVVSVAMFIAVSAFMDYGMTFTEHYYGNADYSYMVTGIDANQAETIEKMPEIENYLTVGLQYGYVSADVPVNECGENFLYDNADGTKSFGAEFLEFEHDTFVQICKELKLDYSKVKGGVLVYSEVTPYNMENMEGTGEPMKLFGKTAPTKFTVHGNDDEGNALITGKLKVSSVFDKIPESIEYVAGDGITLGESLIIGEQGVISPQLGEHGCYITLYANTSDHTSLTSRIESMSGTGDSESYISIYDSEEIVRQFNAVMLIVGIFVYGFIGVISLIGLTNIFNTISTNMQLRSKEFASLKSIGMTKKEFNRMIRLESLMYGIKSLIIGIPLGVLGVFAIFSSFSIGSVPMSFVFPWKAILISIAAVFIVVWLIMKYSISKVNKQNIIETIRNDNI